MHVAIILLLLITSGCTFRGEPKAEFWLTNPDRSQLFQKQQQSPVFREPGAEGEGNPLIRVDENITFQEIDGFGFTLTGGSAILINRMEKNKRKELLTELFDTTGNGIGVSYLRLSIGASDLSDRVFSYNDLPPGETDPGMEHFSIEPEREDLLPVLREILEINPSILILGSLWSPPAWMKTNNSPVGGSLKREFYDAYALYFVRYIREMAREGIRIDAITVQNEPLHPGNNPSLLMLPGEQAEFIRESLGPAFMEAGLDTKIIIYDHNADRIDYPLEVLADPEAAQYIDGTAFHLYGGNINDISKLHDAHPDKNLYFTEQWIGYPSNFAGDMSWHMRNVVVGALRNHCRNVLQWNLASDPGQSIHTPGGCTRCLGAVTIGDRVTRNTAWYIIAHVSKFVPPGSVRIYSSGPDDLHNVAFQTPGGRLVLLVFNGSGRDTEFNVEHSGKIFTARLMAGATGTFVWN